MNEELVLPELLSRVTGVLDLLDGPSEVIFVDDGSRDATYPLLVEHHRRDPRFKVLRLARNFGQQMAMTAGLEFAAGDAVVVMDGDLQDPPEVVPELVKRWHEGFEVVYAIRETRPGDSAMKRWTARRFNQILRRVTKMDLPADAGDFRLIDRRALAAFIAMPERTRWLRGMFSWIGFRQCGVPYERPGRHAGETKYAWRTLVRLGLDSIVSFTDLPLRFVLAFGFVISLGSFFIGVLAIIAKLVDFFAVPGWASIVMVVSFLGGVQLIVAGVVGLYVGRIYEEVKGRPLYLVSEAVGFDAQSHPTPASGQHVIAHVPGGSVALSWLHE